MENSKIFWLLGQLIMVKTSTFAWVAAEQAELLFLNDIGWSPQVIHLNDLLLLLESEPVHLQTPKTHYAQDTGATQQYLQQVPLDYSLLGMVSCDTETEMMKVRWKSFKFHHRISERQEKSISPCGRCFTQLVLQEWQTFRKKIIMKFVFVCFVLFCSTINPDSHG